MKRGIDVSGAQGVIDWKKVKNDGISFAIIKLGNIYEVSENYIDSQFEKNYNECVKNNIPVGLYVYNYCISEQGIKKGIEFIKDNINNKSFSLPIYLDMEDEYIRRLGESKITNLCKIFVDNMKKEKLRNGIYANLYWLTNYIDTKQLDTSIWVAQYNDTCDYNKEKDIWQYTSKFKVNGIKGNVDGNLLYNDNLIKSQNYDNIQKNKYTTGRYIVNTSVLTVRTSPEIKENNWLRFNQLSSNAQEQVKKLNKNWPNGLVKGVKCDVFEIKENWGKIVSGWICLDYCKKVEN